jgi:hypothetical protein
MKCISKSYSFMYESIECTALDSFRFQVLAHFPLPFGTCRYPSNGGEAGVFGWLRLIACWFLEVLGCRQTWQETPCG